MVLKGIDRFIRPAVNHLSITDRDLQMYLQIISKHVAEVAGSSGAIGILMNSITPSTENCGFKITWKSSSMRTTTRRDHAQRQSCPGDNWVIRRMSTGERQVSQYRGDASSSTVGRACDHIHR